MSEPSPVATRTKNRGERGTDAKGVLDQTLLWTASPCSCTLRKLELDAKAEEASGDRVRIVMTSATRDGKKKIRANGLVQRAVRGGILIVLTAMMQEIRQSCGLAA